MNHTCHGNEHMPLGPCLACLREVAEHRASEHGCDGRLDGICAVDEPQIVKWCLYCLLGRLSSVVTPRSEGAYCCSTPCVCGANCGSPVGEKPAFLGETIIEAVERIARAEAAIFADVEPMSFGDGCRSAYLNIVAQITSRRKRMEQSTFDSARSSNELDDMLRDEAKLGGGNQS